MTTHRTDGAGSSVVVAGIQFTRKLADRRHNVDRAAALIREAAGRGATIVALPELFNTGYFPGGRSVSTDYFDLAEPIPGETTEELIALAADLGIHIVAPIFEFDLERALYFNAAAIIGPEGVVGRYRKRHIPALAHMIEKFYFVPGDIAYPVFDVGGCRIGVSICYDRHFPETFRHLTLRGAQVVFSVNNTPTERSKRMWFREMEVTASCNGLFVVQTNACGEREGFFGQTALASPTGVVVDHLGDEEGVLVREIDLAEIARARLHYGAVRDAVLADFGLGAPGVAAGTADGAGPPIEVAR